MSHSTLTGLFLHCPVLFSVLLFFTHQTEQPLMSALCYWFHNLSRHAPTGVYSLGVITSWLVCCPVRVPRNMYLYLIEFAWDTFDSEIVILTCDSQSGEHV